MSVSRQDAESIDRLLTIQGDNLIAERPTHGIVEYLMWHPSLFGVCYVHMTHSDRKMTPEEFIREFGDAKLFYGMTHERLVKWHIRDQRLREVK